MIVEDARNWNVYTVHCTVQYIGYSATYIATVIRLGHIIVVSAAGGKVARTPHI